MSRLGREGRGFESCRPDHRMQHIAAEFGNFELTRHKNRRTLQMRRSHQYLIEFQFIQANDEGMQVVVNPRVENASAAIDVFLIEVKFTREV